MARRCAALAGSMLLIFLSVMAPARAQSDTGAINIEVTDAATKHPLDLARVLLDGPVISAAGITVIVDRIPDGEMPPKGGLPRDQVTVVRAWVLAGAHYPNEPLAPRRALADWWSLRPIREKRRYCTLNPQQSVL